MLYERSLQSLKPATKLYTQSGLRPPRDPDFILGLYDGERIVGAGARKDEILMGLVIDPNERGEGAASQLVTALIREAFSKGIQDLCLFTRPEKVIYFQSLGFHLVVRAPPHAALLEWGPHGIAQYLDTLPAQPANISGDICAIVMNANPFTLGHRYLTERAAAENQLVYIFVVQEDVSAFPFDVRFSLVREGVSDLKNVLVLPGGKYIISALTFPSYFTKENDTAYAHAALDAELFAQRIAPTLGITCRYVGTEPTDNVTAIYNQTLRERLPPKGIRIVEIPRKEVGGSAISASTVRRLYCEGKQKEAFDYLPACTRTFLQSKKTCPCTGQVHANNQEERK